jgi:hypothetical protein
LEFSRYLLERRKIKKSFWNILYFFGDMKPN